MAADGHDRGGGGPVGACRYRPRVDYGCGNELTLDLKKVAGLPTRLYCVSMGEFDTPAAQPDLHQLLLTYLSDAVRGSCSI